MSGIARVMRASVRRVGRRSEDLPAEPSQAWFGNKANKVGADMKTICADLRPSYQKANGSMWLPVATALCAYGLFMVPYQTWSVVERPASRLREDA